MPRVDKSQDRARSTALAGLGLGVGSLLLGWCCLGLADLLGVAPGSRFYLWFSLGSLLVVTLAHIFSFASLVRVVGLAGRGRRPAEARILCAYWCVVGAWLIYGVVTG
ncbi:MAG: hypothetical protein KAI24_06840 [Planctomycetes bacterium]|nr:hypothetical protein [Planctomycetota bacterium]